jgi:hypothetical protein
MELNRKAPICSRIEPDAFCTHFPWPFWHFAKYNKERVQSDKAILFLCLIFELSNKVVDVDLVNGTYVHINIAVTSFNMNDMDYKKQGYKGSETIYYQ